MKTILLSGLIVVLFGFACVATAAPSLSGPTGMAALPNADVTPKGELNISLDLLSQHYNLYSDSRLNSATGMRLLYGLNNRFEIGLGQLDQTVSDRAFYSPEDLFYQFDADNWSLNAKYTTLDYGGFTWAIGGTNQHLDLVSTNVIDTSLYLVGTRDIHLRSTNAPKVHGSIGLNWNHRKVAFPTYPGPYPSSSMKDTNLCLFAGIEVEFANDMDIAVDMMKHPDDTLSSIALRTPLSEALQLQVGITEYSSSLLARGDHITAVNLNYTFDTLSSKRK